jgi:hypothetical protein
MKKSFLLFLVLILSYSTAWAKTSEKTTPTSSTIARELPKAQPASAPRLKMVLLQGKITDNQKEAIAGAMVEVEGQKVYTDFEGNFSLEVPANQAPQLTVSMISYKPQVVKLGSQTSQRVAVILEQ